ncbi:MAG: ribonuclease HI [Hahellaceae bacterium]|jgi:ribonuclease HI|nr:ribonuclease HI [Hahellaceae bacterium]MCP5212880.1 ribonuclease HI [Hahellaceae bacterium]
MKKIRVFTDGACKGNPGKGGWGAVLRYGEHVKEICGGEPATTNNRMELMGAIKALESLKEPCEVDIFTDSQYLRKGITEWIFAWQKNGWKTSARKPVKNADLWQTIWKLVSFHKVNWHWVKAHAGHPENERADELANEGVLTIG